MLAKRDLGSRVVVRQRVGARFTDLLGELVELNETHLTVATLRGPVSVPLDQVHRAKRVPDVPGLERAAAAALPAPTVRPLGDWLLRAADGFTSRANSALPVGDPGMPFSEAINTVTAFYSEHGLPAQIDVPLPLGRHVARRLESRGWAQHGRTVLVLTADLPDLIAATPPGERFSLSPRPSEPALAMIAQRRGPLPEAAMYVLTAPENVTFCEYAEAGDLLAMGRGAVTSGWLGLFFLETKVEARRRGLARSAVGTLARWASQHAARRVYLQVEDTNTPALGLYSALGFTRHHTYARYRLDAPEASAPDPTE